MHGLALQRVSHRWQVSRLRSWAARCLRSIAALHRSWTRGACTHRAPSRVRTSDEHRLTRTRYSRIRMNVEADRCSLAGRAPDDPGRHSASMPARACTTGPQGFERTSGSTTDRRWAGSASFGLAGAFRSCPRFDAEVPITRTARLCRASSSTKSDTRSSRCRISRHGAAERGTARAILQRVPAAPARRAPRRSARFCARCASRSLQICRIGARHPLNCRNERVKNAWLVNERTPGQSSAGSSLPRHSAGGATAGDGGQRAVG